MEASCPIAKDTQIRPHKRLGTFAEDTIGGSSTTSEANRVKNNSTEIKIKVLFFETNTTCKDKRIAHC